MSELSSKERNALPDSQFGLPKERKFPLNDPPHVSNAAARIEHAPKSQQKTLAKKILAKAHKYGMDTSDWDKTKEIAQEEVDTLTAPAPKNQTTNVNSVGGFTETDLERQVYLNSIDTANSFRPVTSSVETADEQITVNDANRIAALIRAQVLRDSKPPTGNQNCQLCTWCAEAQFRGINVLPRPIYSPRDPALEIIGEGIVKNPQQNSIRDKNDVINQVTNAGDGARFYCHVNWNGSAGGHEFLLLNLEGSVYLMDAQQGFVSMISGTGAKSYFDNINYRNSYIARLDDHELNEELLREYNDPSKIIMWDPARDIPYMKENGLLSSLESEYTMRNATMSDLEFVYQSELETVGENKDDPKVQKYIRDDARDSIGHTKIIVVNGEDVGVYQAYATDYYGMRGGDEDWWYLAHIYIKPEYRSFGIGSAIIKKDISEHDKILLQVMKSNTRAKKLYESLGFVVDKENNHGGIVMRIDKTKVAPKSEPVQEYNTGAALMTVQNQLRNILGNSYTFMGSGTIPKFNVKSNAKPSISFDIAVVNGTNAECTPLVNGIPDMLHKKRGIALMRAASVLAEFIKTFVASNSNGSVQESTNVFESGHFSKYKDDVLGFNDEGMAVMKRCDCGGKISIAMKGEPIYTCESCGKTYGCVPFQEGVVGKVIVGGIAIVALINLAIAIKDAIKEKRYEKDTPTDGKLLTSIEKFLTYYNDLEYKDFLTDTGIRYEYIHDTMEDIGNHLKTIIKYTAECINTTSNCYKSNEKMFKEFFTECKTTRVALWDIVCKLDDHVKDYDVDEHCIDKTAMNYRKHYKTLLDQLMKQIEKFLKTLQKTIDSKNVVQEGTVQESAQFVTVAQVSLNYFGQSVTVPVETLNDSFDNDTVYEDLNQMIPDIITKSKDIFNKACFEEAKLLMISYDKEGDGDNISEIEGLKMSDAINVIKPTLILFDYTHSGTPFFLVECEFKYDDEHGFGFLINKNIEITEMGGGLGGLLITDRMLEKPLITQEGAFQDLKNGVNPYSDDLVFHVSMDKHIDGQVWQPRVPDYLDPYNPEDTGFEDNTTPRICFSTSIEGALNGITVNLQRQSPDTFDKMYVYVPEKPWKEYKHKTNKQLVKDKLVYDANVTREVWIMEPVRMKLYGVIRVDQIADAKRKSVVPTSKGQKDTRNYFTYKWHWIVKPKVLKKATKFDYSVETVLSNLCIDVKKFKYGLIKDGRLMTGNVSDADYDKYWVFHSGEMVDQAGGGNCYDMVEYEAGYLEAFGVAYKKYFINATNLKNQTLGTHTICVVPHNGKFIYIEQAFKRVVDEWGYERKKEFDKLNDVFDYVAECMSDYDGQPIDFGVWDYTTADIDYGTPIKNFQEWIMTKCKMIYDGEVKNPTVKKEDK